jgi:hypothetical protein
MGRKFSLQLSKPKCTKCGAKLQVARRQTDYNSGKIVGYCYKRNKHDDNAVLKFEIQSLISKQPDADVIMTVKQIQSDFT